MYSGLLHTHSYLRWLVLILAVYAIVRYFIGWFGKKNFTRGDDSAGLFFIAAVHTQALIGLIMYFFYSPITKTAMANMGLAMKDHVLRFWGVEHIVGMLVAVVLAQVGRTMSKKSLAHEQKFRRGAIFYTLALLAMLATIPWPFLQDVGRPLLP